MSFVERRVRLKNYLIYVHTETMPKTVFETYTRKLMREDHSANGINAGTMMAIDNMLVDKFNTLVKEADKARTLSGKQDTLSSRDVAAAVKLQGDDGALANAGSKAVAK